MKQHWIIPSSLLLALFTFIDAGEVIQPLSEVEAAAIVAAQEQAREAARTSKEAELQSAAILETAIAELGYKKVIFNRVANNDEPAPSGNDLGTTEPAFSQQQAPLEESLLAEAKPIVHLSISGQVDKNGISDLWWKYEGNSYRIFTNANFLYLTGTLMFEDADSRYAPFLLVFPANHAASSPDQWIPGPDDFSTDSIEYYIVEWGDSTEPSDAAFEGIEAMLTHYVENTASLKMAYENQQKLQQARKDYREANPPQERDVIINYRPLN